MRRGPNILVFVIMLAGTVAFGMLTNGLAYSRVASARSSLATVKREVDSVSEVPARLKQSEQKLADAQTALKHLEQGVSGSNYVPTMMRQLEDLGNSCGVEVTAVRPVPIVPTAASSKSKPEPVKPYDTLDIEVKGAAHYRDTLRFVGALDSFPKVVEARTVSLEPSAKADSKQEVNSPKLTLSILLRAYLFKSDDHKAMYPPEVNRAR